MYDFEYRHSLSDSPSGQFFPHIQRFGLKIYNVATKVKESFPLMHLWKDSAVLLIGVVSGKWSCQYRTHQVRNGVILWYTFLTQCVFQWIQERCCGEVDQPYALVKPGLVWESFVLLKDHTESAYYRLCKGYPNDRCC